MFCITSVQIDVILNYLCVSLISLCLGFIFFFFLPCFARVEGSYARMTMLTRMMKVHHAFITPHTNCTWP